MISVVRVVEKCEALLSRLVDSSKLLPEYVFKIKKGGANIVEREVLYEDDFLRDLFSISRGLGATKIFFCFVLVLEDGGHEVSGVIDMDVLDDASKYLDVLVSSYEKHIFEGGRARVIAFSDTADWALYIEILEEFGVFVWMEGLNGILNKLRGDYFVGREYLERQIRRGGFKKDYMERLLSVYESKVE
ncbi:hypothetical protein P3W55_28040 [Pseudomonas citronellolis]|uniref:Uncharacterized protein n=1 Tax=Pseudomonas citronellolis TaxID=53408 RepID=A0AAW6PG40_9PSED|nr:hypothetical protein [Pseudomonas citronellolis]MDF3845575.1 hypothetical protein [Pseudomonas citronellolis]